MFSLFVGIILVGLMLFLIWLLIGKIGGFDAVGKVILGLKNIFREKDKGEK